MKTLAVGDTLSLSIPERIQLVEDIWDTIAMGVNAVQLTDEEKNIIDKRLESYHQNPDVGSSWDEVYARIVKPE